MVKWIKEAWNNVSQEIIIKSFEVCGITSSDPDVISCTRKGEVAESARDELMYPVQETIPYMGEDEDEDDDGNDEIDDVDEIEIGVI